MITPKQHQLDKANECWDILKEKGYVYLQGKPRSGKTLTAILTALKSTKIDKVLVITKKAAIGGWDKFINPIGLSGRFKVINYEQLGKYDTKSKNVYLKENPKDYQLLIVDESHNLGIIGKPNGRYRVVRRFCLELPHIHLSGTAIVESPNSIYHQMSISKFSPFIMYKTFYEYFRKFGVPYTKKIIGIDRPQYDKANDLLMPVIDKFTVYMTQEDAGIDKEVQAIDKIHYVELNNSTKDLYNKIQDDKIFENISNNILNNTNIILRDIKEIPFDLICDTPMKLRTSLHMLESGVIKINDKYLILGNKEKIKYILDTFGDNEDVGIMCHFVGERQLLEKIFKKAKIYSSSAHAEGVDLSHLTHFVILSSDYSGSKFIQRRERIININGSNTTTVNHILVKGAISEQVYKRVSKKMDFNNSCYLRTRL